MKAAFVFVAAILGLSITTEHGVAQDKPGVEKLYILYCGEGVAGDISFWSPGVNVGKTMDFSVNCYLIKHAQGWLLWDTGITDAIAAMPSGLGPAPANPRLTRYRLRWLGSAPDCRTRRAPPSSLVWLVTQRRLDRSYS
jgi:N-acyl homoserine lactone hydrolase